MSLRVRRLMPAGIPRWLGVTFLLALFVSLWGFYFRLSSCPPYVDYDTATLGIFANNLTYHHQYDFFFRASPEFQNRYRMYWAAFALPLSSVISGLQIGLGIAPESIGKLLHAIGLLLGLAGCLSAAAVTTRRTGGDLVGAAFVVGLTAALPPFLLYLRSGLFVLPFAQFWVGVLLLLRFLGKPGLPTGVALAGVLATFAVQPAVPLVVLGLVGSFLVLRQAWRSGVRSVLNPRSLACVTVAVGLYLTIPYSVARMHAAVPGEVRAQAAHFVALRSGRAMDTDYRSFGRLGDKVLKLVHQHFIFRRDELGDRSREDAPWTLPGPLWAWLGLLPFSAGGLILALRRREDADQVFVAVLISSYAVAFAFSFPEGRYLLPVVPCYAYFCLLGIEAVAVGSRVRAGALALALALIGANSFGVVRGEYTQDLLQRHRSLAGLLEAVTAIRTRYGDEYGVTKEIFLGGPTLGYQDWLYAAMLTNLLYRSLDPNDFVRLAQPDPVLFALVEEAPESGAIWERRGFHVVEVLTDAPSGRRLELLANQ